MNRLLNPDNHLFNLTRQGQRLPHPLLAIVLAIVFFIGAQFIGGFSALGLNALLSRGQAEPTNLLSPHTALEQTVFLILIFGPIYLIVWGWLALFEKRPFWTIGLERAGGGLKVLRGFLVGLVMFVASVGISAAFGYVAWEEGPSHKQGLTALSGVLLVLVGWMVQGPAEEVIIRGWLLPVVGVRSHAVWGILASAIIFSILHTLNPNTSLIGLINLLLFGLFTALFALYEGGIWGACGMHAVWNWAQGNLLGFEVSGQAAVGGTLFNLMETGPDIITGGDFGPEGGLSVTVILLVSCVVVVWLASQRRRETVVATP